MLNNFAGSTQIHTATTSNSHGGAHTKKSSGQDRPLSPYTKVFQQPNSVNIGGVQYKRRAHSKREASQQQQMQNLISPQNGHQKQRPGSTTYQIQFQPQAASSTAFNQRRSQSPAANAAGRMAQQTMTLNHFQK